MYATLGKFPLWLFAVVGAASLGAVSAPPRSDDEELISLRAELSQLRSQLAGVEDKLQFVTIETKNLNGVSGPHMLITGCNLHVRSGSGTTDDGVPSAIDESTNAGKYTGLGNFIVGYNEEFAVGLTDRQGAHNCVVGKGNRFPSCGSAVGGWDNNVSGRYTAISGGESNVASADGASVVGGRRNKATDRCAAVGGGQLNTASKYCASVSGGEENSASGDYASVGGGRGNAATNVAASVAGGYLNKATGRASSVSSGTGQSSGIDLFSAPDGTRPAP